MLKKLLQLYKNSKFTENPPSQIDNEDYEWYTTETENGWVGIQKGTLNDKEKQLLETLFHIYEPPVIDYASQIWYNFLFADGVLPQPLKNSRVRIIHLYCKGNEWDKKDLEAALKGFLAEDIVVFWENQNHAILIEQESNSVLMAENFHEISETFESDLYLRVSFFIGKFYPSSEKLKTLFLQDRLFFRRALESLLQERVFTFEKIFPTLVSHNLPSELLQAMDIQLLQPLLEDPETLTTIQVYLENNQNASVTAKKLYIHRNTLQYRLDKFTEKAGVNLKDYPSAITLYIACLLELQKQK